MPHMFHKYVHYHVFQTITLISLPSVALEATNYTHDLPNGFGNPARMDPRTIALRSFSGTADRFNYYCATTPPRPLVAVTTGWLEASQLTSAASTGLRQRYVTVIPHAQEWQRTTAVICMAFGVRSLHAQLARDALQFSSRSVGSSTTPQYLLTFVVSITQMLTDTLISGWRIPVHTRKHVHSF